MPSKRILLLSTRSSGGGAAHATRRLFLALREAGVEVRMLTLVGDEGNESEGIVSVCRGLIGRGYAFVLKAMERLDLIRHNDYIPQPLWRFSPASRGVNIASHAWVQWADVIHLHWINQGFLSLSAITQLQALRKPIVWTLHDLWPVTGGCHIPFRFFADKATLCPSLSESCVLCPLLSSEANNRGYSHQLCEQKRSLHATQSPIHYIAVSRAEAVLFDQSYLRRGLQPCSVIAPPMPHLLEEKDWTRVTVESYTTDVDYILVVAARLDDEVKGFSLLKQTLQHLCDLYPEGELLPHLILVGEVKDKNQLQDMPLRTHDLGSRTASELAYIYSSLASLTLSTSLYETFGQSLTESLGYGTPVIAFNAGGPSDIVQHGSNGYLVEAYDTARMAQYIYRLLRERRTQHLFDADTCKSSVRHFSPSSIAEAHLSLYDSWGMP